MKRNVAIAACTGLSAVLSFPVQAKNSDCVEQAEQNECAAQAKTEKVSRACLVLEELETRESLCEHAPTIRTLAGEALLLKVERVDGAARAALRTCGLEPYSNPGSRAFSTGPKLATDACAPQTGSELLTVDCDDGCDLGDAIDLRRHLASSLACLVVEAHRDPLPQPHGEADRPRRDLVLNFDVLVGEASGQVTATTTAIRCSVKDEARYVRKAYRIHVAN